MLDFGRGVALVGGRRCENVKIGGDLLSGSHFREWKLLAGLRIGNVRTVSCSVHWKVDEHRTQC